MVTRRGESVDSAGNFGRYLSAKKSVDDRSLNRWVYQKLTEGLAAEKQETPLRILEIGCGIGTMVERLWDWGLVPSAAYTAIDRESGLIDEAGVRLREFARRRRLTFSENKGSIRLADEKQEWLITLTAADLVTFCREQTGNSGWDLLLANAFLDLVDLDSGLPVLLSLVRPGGWYYFTLIFDGMTILFPTLDLHFEEQVITLYHRTMDEREGGGAGHSQTGRRLLAALCRHRAKILTAGSSDWVVLPTNEGSYPAEEAFFLSYLLHFIQLALSEHPELDKEKFQSWLSRRQAQIEAGELIFMAHQLDVCGQL